MAASTARPLLGVALMALVTRCFTGMDTTIRYTSVLAPVLLMLFMRYTVQALMTATWIVLDRRRSFRAAHPRFQVVRGSLLLTSSIFGFYGLKAMPVPEVTAVIMLGPVAVTMMSAWWLGERVSALRWGLVAASCIGALIVIRPGSGLFGWAVLLPVASALSYAVFQVLTSRMSGLDDPLTTHFWTGITGSLAMLVVVAALVPDAATTIAALPAGTWALMVLIGLCGSTGHLMLIFAFAAAPASRLMPFTYLQIAWAALLSALVFGTLPDGPAWVGMVVIAACGAASAALNLRGGRVKPVDPPE